MNAEQKQTLADFQAMVAERAAKFPGSQVQFYRWLQRQMVKVDSILNTVTPPSRGPR